MNHGALLMVKPTAGVAGGLIYRILLAAKKKSNDAVNDADNTVVQSNHDGILHNSEARVQQHL